MPGTYININSATDKIVDTNKVTAGYFSNGAGKIFGTGIHSASVSDTNETYYFGVSANSTPTVAEFHVAFGSTNGHGGNTIGGTVKII